jgi:hypothetical protein
MIRLGARHDVVVAYAKADERLWDAYRRLKDFEPEDRTVLFDVMRDANRLEYEFAEAAKSLVGV